MEVNGSPSSGFSGIRRRPPSPPTKALIWLTTNLEDPLCTDGQLAPRKRFHQKLPAKVWRNGLMYWMGGLCKHRKPPAEIHNLRRESFYASHGIFLALQESKSFYKFVWNSLWLLDKGLILAEKPETKEAATYCTFFCMLHSRHWH